MRSTRRIAVGSITLTVGSGLISLASLESIRPRWIVDLPRSAFEALILAGTIAIILGVLLILSNFIYVPALSTRRPRCRPVKRDELELLHDFSEQFFPGSFSLNGAKALYRLNKKMLLVVWRDRAKFFSHSFERKMIGFFSLLPLNREAKKLLEANEFGSEHISSDYVLKTYEGAEAIYLGGVAAGIGSRAHVLAHLVLHLLDLAGQGHKCIYSRPTTRRGLKLAEQYCFEAVRKEGLGNIYKLERERLGERHTDPQRARRVLARNSGSGGAVRNVAPRILLSGSSPTEEQTGKQEEQYLAAENANEPNDRMND